MKIFFALLALASLALSSCLSTFDQKTSNRAEQTKVTSYGKLKNGRDVSMFTFANKHGMVAKVTEYGATLVSLEVPDKEGNVKDVTHGYDDLAGWLTNSSYFGVTVGRYGNRIADGKFSIDGKAYTLATNNDANHLHGGVVGFDKVLWKGRPIMNGVELTYTSKDGEEGYPGNLEVTVTYTLTDRNELQWTARATTDQATPVNIVQHAYWNLSGDPTTSINNHELTLIADHFLPTDAGLIPTGKLMPVAGTPFDFTQAKLIGKSIDEPSEPLRLGKGYDHCWVLRAGNKDLNLAARLHDPNTGRTMELHTDQPGIQFYGGNFLDGTTTGKGGVRYAFRTACCLETQLFPDSPNKRNLPAFPDCILKPGETYSHTMVSRFSW